METAPGPLRPPAPGFSSKPPRRTVRRLQQPSSVGGPRFAQRSGRHLERTQPQRRAGSRYRSGEGPASGCPPSREGYVRAYRHGRHRCNGAVPFTPAARGHQDPLRGPLSRRVLLVTVRLHPLGLRGAPAVALETRQPALLRSCGCAGARRRQREHHTGNRSRSRCCTSRTRKACTAWLRPGGTVSRRRGASDAVPVATWRTGAVHAICDRLPDWGESRSS